MSGASSHQHAAAVHARAAAGFTLLEVMVALAILGTALFILLDAHYATVNLYLRNEEEVTARHLLERALYMAEIEVLAGQQSGNGDFGPRYEGYEYSYTAELDGEGLIPLYAITVTLTTPEEEREMMQYVFLTQPQ